jgi:hypothetical protein
MASLKRSDVAGARLASIGILLADLLIQHPIMAFMLQCSKKLASLTSAQLRQSRTAALVWVRCYSHVMRILQVSSHKKGSKSCPLILPTDKAIPKFCIATRRLASLCCCPSWAFPP